MRVALHSALAWVAACGITGCSLVVDTADLVGDAAPDSAVSHLPRDASADTPDTTAPSDDDAEADSAPDAPADTSAPADVLVADAAVSYRDAVLADAPIAYWRFGESSGTVAHDETGHGNDASLGSGITWGGSGALAFDSNPSIRLTGADGLNAGQKFDFAGTAPYTLEAWINLDSVDNVYRHIFSKNDETPATGREEYGVFVQSNEALTYERWVADTPAKLVSPLPALGAWTYVVATYDGAKMTLYVNGAVIATRADSRAQLAKPVPEYVGCKNSQTGVIHGSLDEIAIYDHALASNRVVAHMSASGR